MINTVGISAGHCLLGLKTEIIKNVSADKIDYVYTESKKQKYGKRYFLYMKGKINALDKAMLECLSCWIVNSYEAELIEKLLRLEFDEFSPKQTAEILQIVNAKADLNYKNRVTKLIVKELSKYFEREKNLSIEGFLNFRLNEYHRAVELLVCEAVEEYFAEREYREFIELVKQYIAEKPAITDLLHIKANANGSFDFFDFRHRPISFYADEIFLFDDLLSEADKVMSVLISLIPKRIIWHGSANFENKSLVKTLEEIFEDSFTKCSGCKLCTPQSPALK